MVRPGAPSLVECLTLRSRVTSSRPTVGKGPVAKDRSFTNLKIVHPPPLAKSGVEGLREVHCRAKDGAPGDEIASQRKRRRYLPKSSGICTATTSPRTHSTPSQSKRSFTTTLRPLISPTVARTSSSGPSGVGFK